MRYSAERWGIEWEEQPLVEATRLVAGDESISLVQNIDQNGEKGRVGTTQLFGIPFSVSEMSIVESFEQVIVNSSVQDHPFIYKDEEGNLVINGRVEKELESWIFAGIGHQLIKEALGSGISVTCNHDVVSEILSAKLPKKISFNPETSTISRSCGLLGYSRSAG
ncbi:MAG: hypothetical protein U5K71_10640 [Gracilimonas sp.]|nr:hypothetical protein [Gracilimonas sp.]